MYFGDIMEVFFCFDLCAAAIMLTVIIAQIVRKMTKGRTNVIFLILCAIVMSTCLLNMADGLFGTFIPVSAFNLYLRYLINYVYFILRNATLFVYLLFLCSYMGIWYSLKSRAHTLFVIILPYAIDFVLLSVNIFNKKMYYFDEEFTYHRGEWIVVLYAVSAFYMLLSVLYLFINRRLIPTKRLWILTVFIPLNALAVYIQMIDPNIRIDNFATALALLSLVIGVQRPEDTLDAVVGTENYNSFVEDVDRVYKTSAPHCLLLIRFVNHLPLRVSLGHETYSELLRTLAEKIYRIDRIMKCHSQAYYIDHGAFAILADEEYYDQILDMGHMLSAYMQESFRLDQLEVMIDARTCLVRIPEDIKELNLLLNFCNNFHNKLPDDSRLISLDKIASSKDFRMRNDMDNIINRGIVNYNFQMYYQPIYSVKEGKFVSAEALIRLEDEQYGFVSPALFIPEAEQSGAIHQIGDFVLEDVCRFIGGNNFASLGLEYIEVNLSVAQCIESDLFEKIDALMTQYNVSPDQINLEITETGTNWDPETTDRNINLLYEKGISFSLDDYGTGYSSIRRVVTLPLDIVKLDKSLVDDMDSPMMWTVITNTVSMLKRMNKKILVEGVENKRAYEKFAALGCDYIQGYYFSKPLNETSFLKFVISKNFGVDI